MSDTPILNVPFCCPYCGGGLRVTATKNAVSVSTDPSISKPVTPPAYWYDKDGTNK